MLLAPHIANVGLRGMCNSFAVVADGHINIFNNRIFTLIRFNLYIFKRLPVVSRLAAAYPDGPSEGLK